MDRLALNWRSLIAIDSNNTINWVTTDSVSGSILYWNYSNNPTVGCKDLDKMGGLMYWNDSNIPTHLNRPSGNSYEKISTLHKW